MSDDELEILEQLAKDATPGPWKWESSIYEHMEVGIRAIPDDRGIGQLWKHRNVLADASFIAAANPQRILALIALARKGAAATLQPGEGWRMVPVRPTDEMLDVACEHDAWTPSELWPIMVAAAPSPVIPSAGGEVVLAAKKEAFDEALSIAEGSYPYGEQQNEIIAGIRAAIAASQEQKP